MKSPRTKELPLYAVAKGGMDAHVRKIERREWWLWTSAILVTLLLTLGIVSFLVPILHPQNKAADPLPVNNAMRGLVGMVLLFDIYTVYQQLQIYRIRRQMAEREVLFRLITENAADMIAVVDSDGRRLYNSPSYQKILGRSFDRSDRYLCYLCPMRIPMHYCARLLGSLIVATASFAANSDIPPHHSPIVLFKGVNLENLDTFLKSQGLNHDPDQVFRVEKGVIHVSGKEFGYIITKQEFANYYLRAEFKWGEGTYESRHGQARDSGILYHVTGPQKVWPTSIEFQILEGGTGDFWLTDGGAVTARGTRATGPPGSAVKVDRIGKGPSKDVTGYRDLIGEVEKPHGQWNLLELVAQGDRVRHFVNGKLVNEGSEAFPSKGKILFQSEGAELFFRNIKLFPLK